MAEGAGMSWVEERRRRIGAERGWRGCCWREEEGLGLGRRLEAFIFDGRGPERVQTFQRAEQGLALAAGSRRRRAEKIEWEMAEMAELTSEILTKFR